MAFKHWFARNILKIEPKYVPKGRQWTDDDREQSLETRRANAEIKRLKQEQERLLEQKRLMKIQAEIAELDDELNEMEEDDDETPINDVTLVRDFLGLLKGNQQQNTAVQQAAVSIPQQTQELSDDAIQMLLNKIPRKFKKDLLNMDDNDLKAFALSYMPGLSESTLDRAVGIFRAGAP